MSEIDNRKYILASIETAFLANGGREHDTKNCQCDASVGMCPCQYCAIHFALEQSETFIKATVQQDAELARLREEISMLRSTWKAPRDCEEERGMSEIGRGMKSLRCKRCGKSPRGKIQTENRKRYDPYCNFNCQEWAKTEYAQRYISKSRSHTAGRGGA